MYIPEELLYAVALAAIGWLLVQLRARRQRAAYIDAFDLAALLDARLAKRRPELDGGQRRQVLEGLREWFHVCREAGRRRVSMPSQAVDDAWHESILFTRNYRDFCRRGLGRFLHHVPAEAPRLSANRSMEGSLSPGATGRSAKVARLYSTKEKRDETDPGLR